MPGTAMVTVTASNTPPSPLSPPFSFPPHPRDRLNMTGPRDTYPQRDMRCGYFCWGGRGVWMSDIICSCFVGRKFYIDVLIVVRIRDATFGNKSHFAIGFTIVCTTHSLPCHVFMYDFLYINILAAWIR